MPGVAGVAEAGSGVETCAGLLALLRAGAAAGLCAATATTGVAGAVTVCVAVVAVVATPAVRETAAPRSTQRSGSSGHTVPARTTGATSALAVNKTAIAVKRVGFTMTSVRSTRCYTAPRLYIGSGTAIWLFVVAAGVDDPGGADCGAICYGNVTGGGGKRGGGAGGWGRSGGRRAATTRTPCLDPAVGPGVLSAPGRIAPVSWIHDYPAPAFRKDSGVSVNEIWMTQLQPGSDLVRELRDNSQKFVGFGVADHGRLQVAHPIALRATPIEVR